MTTYRHRAATMRRRRFLQAAAGAGGLALLDALLPAWARSTEVGGHRPAVGDGPLQFDLTIRAHELAIAGGSGEAVTINDTIPGPLLEWYEGRDVVIDVHNAMRTDTSIHWHGILLPFEMDGVPGVGFRGIRPGTTFQYRFPVKQNGTYWYHSHSGLQEQSGHYGPLVIHPREADAVRADRDYVVLLSDWTFEDPHRVLANLKKMSDYYNYQQVTLRDILEPGDGRSAREALAEKLAWDRMRMMSSDIADVTGATYTYLMNGLHTAGNWTGLFSPGERIRLRFINGSAMSFFNVRIPGLPMSVVAADGQNVEPVPVDEFQIGTAETYDVIVTPPDERAYTVMAESFDRSGFVAGTLATRHGVRARVPPVRKPPRLTMVDMGMDHGDMAPAGSGANAGDGNMNHNMSHGNHSMPMDREPGPVVARHGPDQHGPGNIGVATVQRDRLGERGTGLGDVPHRVLVYTDLRRLERDFDERSPARDLELHLTGHMERYMWSFDGVQFHEVDGPVDFHYGERLRLILVNDTMMNHPIHLHGMWLEIENGQDTAIPRKHTINVMPGGRVSALVNADAPGRWAFHCHLLYHMEMGMFRVVRVS